MLFSSTPGSRPLRTLAVRSLVGFGAVQAAVVAALVGTDAVQRRKRARRTGFPRPGTFEGTVAGTGTTAYTYGEDLYRDMLAAIRGAQRRILLETFIWKGDEVGRAFRDALNDAAARGVEVYVMYDGFGNLVVPASFYRFHPDVHVYRVPPVRVRRLLTPVQASGLTHRKILVVDDEVGFVGGYNIGSLYATEWRDTHVRLTGPEAFELSHSFAAVWNHPSSRRRHRLPHLSPGEWDSRVRSINNIPASLVYPIRSVYLDAIHRARHHIHLTTAYFIPDQQILEALVEASRRGVDVRVILPENSNHVLADWLAHGFYSALLAEDITLLLYRNAMIHAKTATIDGQWSMVGTANIDRLSLGFNYETTLEIHDETFAADMERIFAADSENCRTLTAEQWHERHPAARFAELVLKPLRPFL
ncbi:MULTISPECIES: phospholipase D-like domain-containing protein [Kocuria]|jgi:cardiolipin synthase|uniref:phospholipase D-like domain-containing protein n=1 Tax=Kocuria TaxID=57493 RepID=UPI00203CF6A6|nr:MULTISPECIES: phospholipase D-like domain-containing protein [Kocuria]MCM3687656.1 phospholipase D-like domain-containing protein [Kocuria rosea]